MSLPELTQDQALFVEERYIRPLFCFRLASICAARSSIPHVDLAQGFAVAMERLLPGNTRAKDEAARVSALLADDGHGVNNRGNKAVGYRLHRAADLFRKIESHQVCRIA